MIIMEQAMDDASMSINTILFLTMGCNMTVSWISGGAQVELHYRKPFRSIGGRWGNFYFFIHGCDLLDI